MLTVRIDDHIENLRLSVTNTGLSSMILGHSWLKFHNPEVDWSQSRLCFSRCPISCGSDVVDSCDPDGEALRGLKGGAPASPSNVSDMEDFACAINDVLDDGDRLLAIDLALLSDDTLPHMAACEHVRRVVGVPLAYPDRYMSDFSSVFSKDDFDELPPRRPWDHAINLKPDAKTVKAKIFALSPAEKAKLKEWVAEQKCTGRIRDSISPFASPFFFIKKKDGELQ